MSGETNGISREAAGMLSSGVGGPWSRAHVYYCQAVTEELKAYLSEIGIDGSEMTAAQAEAFIERVKRSTDPRILNLLELHMKPF